MSVSTVLNIVAGNTLRMADEVHQGLEGVLVTESELSKVDGEAGRLIYRGYSIESLAREASFEEVLGLLWHGDLPDQAALDALSSELAAARHLDDSIHDLVRRLAAEDEDPMAALRTTTSALSSTDQNGTSFSSHDTDDTLERGLRITAKLPTIVAAYDRYRNGEEPVSPRDDLGHAENFLYMLTGERPDEVSVSTLDAALVLHADHGLNASTFAAMVTASSLSDVHSAITSAIGTLAGPLHGGANQNVMRMLLDIDESDRDAAAWVNDALDDGERIPGFGHRVYRVKDPRAYILAEMSEDLGAAAGDLKWYEYSVAVEDTMNERAGIPPNVDFYSATTYYQMDISIDLYTPIFAMSRVGGWVAHVNEQYADNRIMRPRSRYVGPDSREFVPLADR